MAASSAISAGRTHAESSALPRKRRPTREVGMGRGGAGGCVGDGEAVPVGGGVSGAVGGAVG